MEKKGVFHLRITHGVSENCEYISDLARFWLCAKPRRYFTMGPAACCVEVGRSWSRAAFWGLDCFLYFFFCLIPDRMPNATTPGSIISGAGKKKTVRGDRKKPGIVYFCNRPGRRPLKMKPYEKHSILCPCAGTGIRAGLPHAAITAAGSPGAFVGADLSAGPADGPAFAGAKYR